MGRMFIPQDGPTDVVYICCFLGVHGLRRHRLGFMQFRHRYLVRVGQGLRETVAVFEFNYAASVFRRHSVCCLKSLGLSQTRMALAARSSNRRGFMAQVRVWINVARAVYALLVLQFYLQPPGVSSMTMRSLAILPPPTTTISSMYLTHTNKNVHNTTSTAPTRSRSATCSPAP